MANPEGAKSLKNKNFLKKSTILMGGGEIFLLTCRQFLFIREVDFVNVIIDKKGNTFCTAFDSVSTSESSGVSL